MTNLPHIRFVCGMVGGAILWCKGCSTQLTLMDCSVSELNRATGKFVDTHAGCGPAVQRAA